MSFIDGVLFFPTAGGTGDFTPNVAVTGYRTPSGAAVVDGATYSYRAESIDRTQWEIGRGVYNAGTGVFARTTVLFNSLGTTAKISFTTIPQVGFISLAEDAIVTVASIAALKAADTKSTIAFLSAAGRSGYFIWTLGDYSANIAADTNNGVYVASNAFPTATTGAWVRVFDFIYYKSLWFGTIQDHSTDNSTVINTIIATANTVNTLSTPGKQSAAYIDIEGGVRFASKSLSFLPSANFIFVNLIYFANSDTTGGVSDGGGGTNERIRLGVNSGYPGDNTGGIVDEDQHHSTLHPNITLNIAKQISGADAHFGINQVRNPTATSPVRASLSFKDENVLRLRAVYEGYAPETSSASRFALQPFYQQIVLTGVGSSGWGAIPANGTIMSGVTTGAKGIKVGHTSSTMTLIWVSGTFLGTSLAQEFITNGTTTSPFTISSGGVAATSTTNPFLAFGINNPVVTYGVDPLFSITGFDIGARLTLRNSTGSSGGANHKEIVSNAALLFTSTGASLPVTAKQIVLNGLNRLVTVLGIANGTGSTGTGLVGGIAAHGIFNGATAVLAADSFNVATTGYQGSNVYRVTMANGLVNPRYSVSFTTDTVGNFQITAFNKTTTTFDIKAYNAAGVAIDIIGNCDFTVAGGQ